MSTTEFKFCSLPVLGASFKKSASQWWPVFPSCSTLSGRVPLSVNILPSMQSPHSEACAPSHTLLSVSLSSKTPSISEAAGAKKPPTVRCQMPPTVTSLNQVMPLFLGERWWPPHGLSTFYLGISSISRVAASVVFLNHLFTLNLSDLNFNMASTGKKSKTQVCRKRPSSPLA